MNAETRKRGLGRGLDALFRDVKNEQAAFDKRNAAPEAKVRRTDEMVAAAQPAKAAPQPVAAAGKDAGVRRVAVEKLSPGKFQPRRHFDVAALDQLAESVGVHGVLQPLLVRPLSNSMFEIIAGERRWRAAQKAQVHDVPVVVRDMTDKEAMEIALIENLQREDLSAIEEAEGYQRLTDEFGHNQEDLARQLGKSRSHIANTLRLLKLPVSVRAMVQDGSLSAGHARALVGAKNPEELADVIVRRGLNVRQAEKLAQEAVSGKAKPKPTKGFKQKDVDILALEQKTTQQLGLKVSIAAEGETGKGKLVIEYKSLDQLDDVLARLAKAPNRS